MDDKDFKLLCKELKGPRTWDPELPEGVTMQFPKRKVMNMSNLNVQEHRSMIMEDEE